MESMKDPRIIVMMRHPIVLDEEEKASIRCKDLVPEHYYIPGTLILCMNKQISDVAAEAEGSVILQWDHSVARQDISWVITLRNYTITTGGNNDEPWEKIKDIMKVMTNNLINLGYVTQYVPIYLESFFDIKDPFIKALSKFNADPDGPEINVKIEMVGHQDGGEDNA